MKFVIEANDAIVKQQNLMLMYYRIVKIQVADSGVSEVSAEVRVDPDCLVVGATFTCYQNLDKAIANGAEVLAGLVISAKL